MKNLPGKRMAENKKVTLKLVPMVLFIATFIFCSEVNAQSSSTNNPENTVYKFTVDGIMNPSDAASVMSLLMEQSFSASCTFIDEADCFKLTSQLGDLDYLTLEAALKKEGFVLSPEVYTSDGRTLNKK